MASEPERSDAAEKRSVTAHAIYERRAADAIRHLIAGPNADKLTARAFNVSVRMAQNLRAGKCWTIQRLTQASAVLGEAFDAALYSPVSSAQHHSEMAEITARLARLEVQIAGTDRGGNTGLAPPSRTEAYRAGREVGEPLPGVGREVDEMKR